MVDVIYVYADPYDDMVHLTKKELQEAMISQEEIENKKKEREEKREEYNSNEA